MFDLNAGEAEINFDEVKRSTLDELHKLINQCLNSTDSRAENSNPERSDSESSETENSDSESSNSENSDSESSKSENSYYKSSESSNSDSD